MNKMVIGIVVVVVLIGGYLLISQKQQQPSQSQPVVQQPTTQPSQPKAEVNTIVIKNFSFEPKTLIVKQGVKVTWINQDSATHTIKSNNFNSSDLNQGDKFEFTFDKKGSFDYTCGIHPSMKGKIVVE